MANVWSINYKDGRAVVVDQGAKKHCEESAARRNASAERLGVRMKFLALADGQVPGEEDLADPNLYLTPEEVTEVIRQAGALPAEASYPSPYL